MADTLIRTKLYIPSSRRELVARPHLIERLSQGLQRKLTLVSAPPGFGKTTLISGWIASLRSSLPTAELDEPPESIAGRLEFAWVSLDAQDNDPVRFWSYVFTALESAQADMSADALALVQAPQAPPIETTLTTLINAFTNAPHRVVLILDDYQAIDNPSIHQAVTFLLEHLPPQLHLVMTSRSEPPFPLTRLRVHNQLSELRESDLRFTPAEAVTFLNQIMQLNLSPDEVNALEQRTEGWVAGLQLAAVSIQGHRDTPAFVKAFTGSHRYVIDYLAEEVLVQQPAHIRTFLLQTSILDQLCAPLCDSLIQATTVNPETSEINDKGTARLDAPDISAQSTSQDILEYLEQSNLFLIPLDAERRWYRYHHLFADFLREDLRQSTANEVIMALQLEASKWYAEAGLMTEAVKHALAADDSLGAGRLVEQVILPMLTSGEVTTVIGWLDALPEALIRSRPRLALGRAWAMVITLQWNKVESLVEAAESELAAVADENAAVKGMRGEIAALRAMLVGERGVAEEAIEQCQLALADLPEENLAVRSIITMTLGVAYERLGDFDLAIETLNKALALGKEIDGITIILPIVNNIGRIQEELGRLHQAAEYYQEAQQLIEQRAAGRGQSGQPHVMAGWIYLNLAEVQREWNNLAEAHRFLATGLQLTQQLITMNNTTAIGHLILARVLQAEGNETGALQSIQRAKQMLERDSLVAQWVPAIQARLWLAQGNVAAAAQWAQASDLPLDERFDYALYPGEYSTLVRVYLAQERFEEAADLLDRMQSAVEAAGRTGRLVEILMLQALRCQAQGDTEAAIPLLLQSLSLAEAGGYVRLYADEGAPMARLLRLIKARGSAPSEAYVGTLLAACEILPRVANRPDPRIASSGSESLLVENLSEREMEVLRLVADGLSNREIAEQLFITVGTAKTHTINIYRKLDVRSRTQAVARATELGLL